MSVLEKGRTPQGEIITEIVVKPDGSKVIYLHGIGLHPYARVGLHTHHAPRRSQRDLVQRLANKYVVDAMVVMTDAHPTGRIYAVYSTRP